MCGVMGNKIALTDIPRLLLLSSLNACSQVHCVRYYRKRCLYIAVHILPEFVGQVHASSQMQHYCHYVITQR